MNKLFLSDATLRDGNHAASHQLSEKDIEHYAKAVDKAGVDYIEVGHGNGIGASSFQIGFSSVEDKQMLQAARKVIQKGKLSVHVIPGFATIQRDIEPAIDWGVDLFRLASHCTEADITKRHIEYVRMRGKECHGVLMMSHMASKEQLREEALKMQSYGAQAIIIMDSAGAYLPKDVQERISELRTHLQISVGFHAHNNLGMAIANSIAAVESGATIIDGTARGFGAGAGNAQIEVLGAVLQKMQFKTSVDLDLLLEAAEIAEKEFISSIPFTNSSTIVSGLNGVFSGFIKHVNSAASKYQVDPKKIFLELGKRKAVAGQEDMIFEIASMLQNQEQ